MNVLRIEHAVPDFESWKRAFDQDPVGRRKGGVRRYRVSRSHEDPRVVLIDLEFDGLAAAEAFQDRLRVLWGNVQGGLIERPRVTILDIVEDCEC